MPKPTPVRNCIGIALVAAAVFAAAPKAPVEPVKESIHGVEIVDPYRWLEDQNSPETRAWIDDQNRYSRPILDGLPGRAALAKRLGELLKTEVVSIPVERNGRYFFTKRLPDQQLPVIYLRQGLAGRDEPLVDPHPLSADHRTSVLLAGASKDGTLLAYGVRQGGEDEIELRLLDVNARRELPDRWPKARYSSLVFTPDNRSVYYARFARAGPRLFRRALGAGPDEDREVFGSGLGPDKYLGATLSHDGRFLLISVWHGTQRNELFIQDLKRRGPVVPVLPGIQARSHGMLGENQLFVQTDWKAANGRVLVFDLTDPEVRRWRIIVPETKAVIEESALAGGRVLVRYLENVASRIRVFTAEGRRLRDLVFPELGSIESLSGRWESGESFFQFTSYHAPPAIYRYEVPSGRLSVWAETSVPLDRGRFELRQVWYTSKDKTRVPMFLFHRRGLKLDGSNAALLTGYGGFKYSETPAFSPRAVVWAEQGGVYAVPNLRGGGEFGEPWHRAGMLERKQNVFDDFIAAAEWLVERGYTRPPRLAIAGSSNGGLLVGAALTQRPDLFRAVLCINPLLDMVRYHKFSVAAWWVPEYGSAEDAAQFKHLHAYSPYHHVKPGTKYPAVLLVTGDADTRVAPLHARKMTALLQAATASGLPVLLRYDIKGGHVGGRPVARLIEDLTDETGFLLWQTRQ